MYPLLSQVQKIIDNRTQLDQILYDAAKREYEKVSQPVSPSATPADSSRARTKHKKRFKIRTFICVYSRVC